MKRLTERQQKFAELVASGMSQTDAYGAAGYSCETWKREAVQNKASELANKPWVKDEIMRLTPSKPVSRNTNVADAKEIMAMYTQIIRDPTATAKEKMEAAKALTALRGEVGNVQDENASKEFMHLVPGSFAMSQLINMALQVKNKKMREEHGLEGED